MYLVNHCITHKNTIIWTYGTVVVKCLKYIQQLTACNFVKTMYGRINNFESLTSQSWKISP